MGFTLSEQQVKWGTLILSSLALVAALGFWGRGIRRSHKSDQVVGVLVLAALCFVLFYFGSSRGWAGLAIFVFGFVTLPLSGLAQPGGEPSERELVLTGLVLMGLGIAVSVILV
mgnify:CR=1 FL=1